MRTCRLLSCGPLSALVVLSGVLVSVGGLDFDQPMFGAYAPGDVIVGILLPCHRKVAVIHERIRPENFMCSDFDPTAFMRSLAVIHEIEKVNAAGFLPVQLGYLMCDTCSYASKALENVLHMLAVNRSGHEEFSYNNFRVKIILGARYSEESIAVARLLNVYMVPLLSSTSSSPELSDKPRFSSFIRTVPSDIHQTRALAKLMNRYQWNWVGVLYGDDDYGKAALDSFLRDAGAHNVCLAYQEVVPHYLDQVNSEQRIEQVARQIRSSTAQVVLLILKSELVELLFKEMIRTGTTRTWIASDAWSRSGSLAQMDGVNEVGDILGFTFVARRSESFDNYLQNLSAPPGGYNRFIEEYKNLRFNCSTECFSSEPPPYCPSSDLLKMKSHHACDAKDPQEQNDDYLVTTLDTSEAFLHRVGVWATAHALKKLLKCNSSSCSGDRNFEPWELLRELKAVKFTYENLSVHFDENGDSTNGYDLVRWEKSGQGRRFQKIGTYQVVNEQIEFDREDFTWYSTGSTTAPRSRCSESCPGGSEKKILNVSCCYNCTQCVEGMYSDDPDMSNCKECPRGTWSLKGWDHCEPRTEAYLRWADPHPIAVTVAAATGIFILLVTLIIFLVYRDSPAIKRAELRLSCVMKTGLVASFVSVLCFMGEPSVHLCRARQLTYAMGFTLCVSCIVVKAYRTFLAFFPETHRANRSLHRVYKPPVIVSVLTGVQGIICLLWMILDSPDIDDTPPSPQSMERVIQCTEGETYIGFGIMLSYIGLLVFVCFLLAFKGRTVPQEKSETGYIIFSMLMYLFVWVCFIPLYITRNEEGTIVQASAILVSTYGVVFCHFCPKCYEAIKGSRRDVQSIRLRNSRRTRSVSL